MAFLYFMNMQKTSYHSDSSIYVYKIKDWLTESGI